MIDTDKYEGHTPKHWRRKYNFGQMPFNKADENLIYDAPLLLAEVKRLRELLKITAQSYLDSVRTEDMLGEVSVKKDYEICKSIGNAIGARIVWESRIDENTGHDTVYEHPYFTYEEEEYYRGEEE